MNIPKDLRYAKTHEWLRGDGTVGITDHAQAELTDIVFVDLPEVGREVQAGEVACVVESVKAASDIYAPVAGRIVAVNVEVGANPALVNTDSYGAGWLFRMEPANPADRDGMLTVEEYGAQIS